MSLARNYARVLYEEAQSKGGKDAIGAISTEIADFLKVVESSEAAKVALIGPVTSAKEKVAITTELGTKMNLAQVTKRFLQLVADNRRLGLLSEILTALEQVRVESEGGLLGLITSADPLDPADIKGIAESFGQKLGKKVDFRVNTDPTLLAGLKVTLNGVTYDGTLRSQLNRLKDEFVSGTGAFR